jgi:hypothetical protein
MSVAALLFACALGASPPQQPETSDPSLDRILEALAKPPSKLTVPERVPDFTLTIREQSREKALLPPILDFKVGPGVPQESLFTSPVGSQPLFKVDLIPAGFAVGDAIRQLRKAYTRRAALEEVRRTIAEYCDAQPGRALIEICAK